MCQMESKEKITKAYASTGMPITSPPPPINIRM